MRAPTRRALRLLPAAFCSLLALALSAGEVFGPDRLHPVLREEPHPLRHVPVAHLHHRSLRDLLLPGARTASRTGRVYAESAYQHVSTELKHELGFKVPLVLFKTHAEFQQQNVAPMEVPEGVGRVRRAAARAHGAADRRTARSALSLDYARTDPRVPVRHHPALAGPPRLPAVDRRRHGRLHGRRLVAARSDERARRRGGRHRAEDDGVRGVRRLQQSAHHLQPRPRRLRVHGIEVGQGRHPPVRLLAAQERHRRRQRRLRGSVPRQAG